MKNLINLLVLFIMSTQFVFAKASEINQLSEVTDIISQVEVMETKSPSRSKMKLIKLLDRAIEKSSVMNERFENSLLKVEKTIVKILSGKKERTKALLQNNRLLQRLYQKSQAHNNAQTLSEFKTDLEKSISDDYENEIKSNAVEKLRESGSITSFLKEYRLEVIQGDQVTHQKNTKEVQRAPADGDVGAEILMGVLIALIVGAVLVVLAIVGIAAAVTAATSISFLTVVGVIVGGITVGWLVFMGVDAIVEAIK